MPSMRTSPGGSVTPPLLTFARKSIERLSTLADAIVVSQTPHEALAREWEEHSIDRYVRTIAGQELGTKTEHITMASEGANTLTTGILDHWRCAG
ncbi:MAG: hypothetical protein U5L72_16185 [Bacteroidales bacterium]|nr:hypothetical protein [Bacteroidales bacterium]